MEVIRSVSTNKIELEGWRKNKDQDSITFTRAPMTPREVNRRYSKGLVLLVVFKKGYKSSGI